jgi:hypothetical protein
MALPRLAIGILACDFLMYFNAGLRFIMKVYLRLMEDLIHIQNI